MKGTAGFVLVFAKVKRVKFLKGLETVFGHGIVVSNKIKKIPDSRRGCVFTLLQLDQSSVEWAVALGH